MKKVFVTLCQQDDLTFLPKGLDTEIYYAPVYEHAYKKIENAVRALALKCEVVRVSGCGVEGTVSKISAGVDDIVVFASPFVFLASNADVEGAINYITKTDFGYSTVGNERSLYMAVGISKMISKRAVGTPREFVDAITEGGAMCPHAAFAENESSIPKSVSDFHAKTEQYRREFLEYFVRFGVSIECFDGVVISPTASIELGAKIYTGCHVYGKSIIASEAKIGPNAIIKSSVVGETTVVGSSQVYDSVLEKNVVVESYCVIKEKSHLISGVKVSNYCEIANTVILNDTTVSSHSHLWDAEIGSRVIVGSNVTTINYEVNRKQSKCKIGDDSIIGCGSNIVLPIDIGAGSFVAAGSTITDNVPPGALAIAREYQTNQNGWAARRKNHGKHI